MRKNPWFKIAERELGVAECPGAPDNPRIVEYLESTSLGKPDNQNDETPWCSAFVNWCVEHAGEKGTNSAWARSWRNWGREIEANYQQGDIVVLERGPNSGHVGFYYDYDPDNDMVQLLGGNQADKVCYAWFPWDRVLSVRSL